MYYSIELFRLLAVVLITFTHLKHDFNQGMMYILLEQIPLFGTLILSVISGFLYMEVTAKKGGLLQKKVRSLLVPYLIANIVVIIPVIVADFLGINFLNRLEVGPELLTSGLLSLSEPPINPPTYFIRDLFIIFMIIEMIKNKNIYILAGLITLFVWGEVLLRYDILVLFIIGLTLSRFSDLIRNYYWITALLILFTAIISLLLLDSLFFKHIVAVFLFILLLKWEIGFVNVGGYSYTLHLYHAPVIVVTSVVLNRFTENSYLLVTGQLLSVFVFVSLIFFIIRKTHLRVAIGGR